MSDLSCPVCGGHVTYNPNATVVSAAVYLSSWQPLRGELPHARSRKASFVSCDECEFAATVSDVLAGKLASEEVSHG